MKKSINLLIVIGMYLLIYNPPVLGSGIIRVVGPFRNLIWAVAPVSVLYVICNLKWLKENLDWKAILRTECIIRGARPQDGSSLSRRLWPAIRRIPEFW